MYAYCSQQPQHYLNFGGDFWTSSDGEYFNARPTFEVHYEGIKQYASSISSAPSAPALGGGGEAEWQSVSFNGGIQVAELPPLHALGAQAPAPAAPDAPLLAEAELPKKKRIKTLKFFDVSTDGSGRAAE